MASGSGSVVVVGRHARSAESDQVGRLVGAIGGLGVMLWGGAMAAQYSGFSIDVTGPGGRAAFGVVATALLVGLLGIRRRYVAGRLGTVAVVGMAVALLGVIVGGIVGLVATEVGSLLVFASYPFVVGTGTVLGIHVLRTDGPRTAAWLLTASLPTLVLTDKVLWDPLVAALGFDVAPLLFTWPFGLGMALLAMVAHRTARAGAIGNAADRPENRRLPN